MCDFGRSWREKWEDKVLFLEVNIAFALCPLFFHMQCHLENGMVLMQEKRVGVQQARELALRSLEKSYSPAK